MSFANVADIVLGIAIGEFLIITTLKGMEILNARQFQHTQYQYQNYQNQDQKYLKHKQTDKSANKIENVYY